MASQLSLFTEYIPLVAKFPKTRYQGSKQKFVDWIWDCVKDIPFHSALDAFGGTGSVSFRLKEEGKQVTYNDILPFNYIIGKALIENKEICLTDCEINSKTKIIYDSAFKNCSQLKSINIPSSVITIGESVFCNCSLRS